MNINNLFGGLVIYQSLKDFSSGAGGSGTKLKLNRNKQVVGQGSCIHYITWNDRE